MKFRLVTALVLTSSLALTGAALRPLEETLPADSASKAGTESTEQAVARGLLGGFRAAAADVVWLRAFVASEERDLPATETMLRLATDIDPRPLYFWVNGARITAYDMAAWRSEAAGGRGRFAEAAQWHIAREQAAKALQRLDAAMVYHPASAALWIERANLQLNRLNDVAGAAESYRRAWEQPGAPYFTARLHAELLRRQGRKAEALAWLRRLLPQLPLTDESAGADLVRSRIRDLESELNIPSSRTNQRH